MTAVAALYRRHVDHRARRRHSVAIISPGSRRTVFGCVCGAEHSEAATWGRWAQHSAGGPRSRSVHAGRWIDQHDWCMAAAVAAALDDPSMACIAAVGR